MDKLQTRIKILETEIRDLKELLKDTQAERDLYKQTVEENHGGGGAGHKTNKDDLALQAHSSSKLPQEILGLVFGNNLQNPSSLLNCRLACKNWKLAVDNSPPIMRNLTFFIYDWLSLAESTIIDTVKSVRIVLLWNVDVKNGAWLEFVRRLVQAVEKIKFEFCEREDPLINHDLATERCASVAASLLNHCAGLKQLDILNPSVLGSLSVLPDLKLNAGIMHLTLVTTADTLEKLIFQLPNLLTITIKNAHIENGNSGIRTILCEYIFKINKGTLKKITMDGLGNRNRHNWFKYIFMCANRGIELNCMENPLHLDAIDVVSLLSYEETPEAPVNELTCQYFKSAIVEIKGSPMRTYRIGFYTNASFIRIDLSRRCTVEEVTFLKKLHKLENLVLVGSSVAVIMEEEDNDVAYLFPCQIFEFGCPTLQNFGIYGDIIGRNAKVFSSFDLYFPDLKSIILSDLGFYPAEILVHLSKLHALEEIIMSGIRGIAEVGLPQITNEMFTRLCESQRPGQLGFVPAITAFKNISGT